LLLGSIEKRNLRKATHPKEPRVMKQMSLA
jgi:hypothetical protein